MKLNTHAKLVDLRRQASFHCQDQTSETFYNTVARRVTNNQAILLYLLEEIFEQDRPESVY